MPPSDFDPVCVYDSVHGQHLPMNGFYTWPPAMSHFMTNLGGSGMRPMMMLMYSDRMKDLRMIAVSQIRADMK